MQWAVVGVEATSARFKSFNLRVFHELKARNCGDDGHFALWSLKTEVERVRTRLIRNFKSDMRTGDRMKRLYDFKTSTTSCKFHLNRPQSHKSTSIHIRMSTKSAINANAADTRKELAELIKRKAEISVNRKYISYCLHILKDPSHFF